MNIFDWSKIARIGLLIISLTVLTGTSVSAQNTNTRAGTTETTRADRDDDTDWGWLGLLGLLGLAGLLPRKRAVEVRDDNRTTAAR